jgi:asparagine synthetase B (glutamine-hydrolysing)
MKVTTYYQSALRLVTNSEPVFYTHIAAPLYERIKRGDFEQHVIGRRYRGLFDENDGSYVTLTTAESGAVLIDRDSYGSIPLFYLTDRPVVSTNLKFLIETCSRNFSFEALAEYLSAAYLTAGKTIYENIRWLMPNEKIVVQGNRLAIKPKDIFPEQSIKTEQEASHLIERALDNSLENVLGKYSDPILLNLSGGTDSTLLLAKMRRARPSMEIVTTTYFHEDWREDLNDWKYADQASKEFSSRHQLTCLNNETFCRAHREFLGGTRNVCHTYAPAFYAQNKAVNDWDSRAPILNGSGPDESIIGTEKIAIAELLSLREIGRDKWIDHLIGKIDYIKLPETTVAEMLRGESDGFIQSRKDIATTLLSSPNFVEFQRRYHVLTVLQDHIQELSSVASFLDRSILFPYLTNDMFRIIFGASFETLNFNGVYKSAMKVILEKYMPEEFVYRTKIGFQSPSRPYFKSGNGLGHELSRLLSKKHTSLLNLDLIASNIRSRLEADLDLRQRYDFLEWTSYNILLLEEFRSARV